jgi:peptidoglycan hydrolase CwlO-like protein
MKFSLFAFSVFAASATAFVPQLQKSSSAFVSGRAASLRMSDDSENTGGALVPVKEETVEFTAGIIGGIAGFALGGPVLGAVGAAIANYVSKMDGDLPVAVQAISKSSIEVFNYLANIDKKYSLLESAKSSLQTSLDKLKSQESVDPATIEKVESALTQTNAKIKEINDEYDLVGGATTALGVFGDLIEKAVTKAGELNEEYQLSSKAQESLAKAVEKAKEAAKSVEV